MMGYFLRNRKIISIIDVKGSIQLKFRSFFPQSIFPFLALLLFLLSTPVMGCSNDLRGDSVESELMIIEEIENNSIVMGTDRYIVTKSTVILDMIGKKITLCDLPLPCKAEVEYRLRINDAPICLKIVVKRLLEDPDITRSSDESD